MTLASTIILIVISSCGQPKNRETDDHTHPCIINFLSVHNPKCRGQICCISIHVSMLFCRGAVVLGNTTLFASGGYIFFALHQDELNPDLIVCGVGSSLATVNKLTGEFITIAGDENNTSGYVEGVGSQARFHWVAGVSQTRTHYIVSDHFNSCVRSVRRNSHKTSTFAGNCTFIGTNDGPLLAARLTRPYGLTKYSDEIFYLCDDTSLRILDLVTGSLQTLPHQTQPAKLYNSVIQPSGDLLISADHGVLQIMGNKTQWVAGGLESGYGCENCSLSASSYTSPFGISVLTPTVLMVTHQYGGLQLIDIFSNTSHSIVLPKYPIAYTASLLVDHHTNTIYIGGGNQVDLRGGLAQVLFSGKKYQYLRHNFVF